MQRFNLGQRIVAVVALGVILVLVGAYLTGPVPFSGWTGYAPLQRVSLTEPVVSRDGLAPVANLFVGFGLVLGWCAGSLVLLRDPLHRRRAASGQAVDAGSPSTETERQ